MCLLFSDTSIKFPFSCSTNIYMYNNTSLTCTPKKKNRYVSKHIVFQIRDFRKRSSTFDVLNTQPGSPDPIIYNSTIGQYTRSLGYLCQKLVPALIFIRLLIGGRVDQVVDFLSLILRVYEFKRYMYHIYISQLWRRPRHWMLILDLFLYCNSFCLFRIIKSIHLRA